LVVRANAIFEDETLHNAVDIYLEFTEYKDEGEREEDKSSISLTNSPSDHELFFLQTHFLVYFVA